MKRPDLHLDKTETLLDCRFLRVYDILYGENRHYYSASRRVKEDTVFMKSDREFRDMLPDAVTLVVILEDGEKGDRILLSEEYRYPVGQFLLSPPAGLMDPGDREKPEPLFETARRELLEETGLEVREGDEMRVLSPLMFSSPGMTDESNALVLVVLHGDHGEARQSGAVGSECFDGFRLMNREEAARVLKSGRDPDGRFYSVFTWAALNVFVSGSWRAGGEEQ